jgi:hypothetical protein
MATISESQAYKFINNWIKFGQINDSNDVAFFAFERAELASLFDQADVVGIRFHLAEASGKISSPDLCMVATGVKLNAGNVYEDVFDKIILNISKTQDSKYDTVTTRGEKHKIAKGTAKKWIEEYNQVTTPKDKKCIAKDHKNQECKLWASSFVNDEDSTVEVYIRQENYRYLLVHLAVKRKRDDARVQNDEEGLTAFILSGSNDMKDDKEIIEINATTRGGTSSVLEFGTACPPQCGGTCC